MCVISLKENLTIDQVSQQKLVNGKAINILYQ